MSDHSVYLKPSETSVNFEALFLLLDNATLSISEKDRRRVFQDMAYKLIEWYDVSRFELRNIFDNHGIVLEELCYECNMVIQDSVVDKKDNTPRCLKCRVPYASADAGRSWLDQQHTRIRGAASSISPVGTPAAGTPTLTVGTPGTSTWDHWFGKMPKQNISECKNCC